MRRTCDLFFLCTIANFIDAIAFTLLNDFHTIGFHTINFLPEYCQMLTFGIFIFSYVEIYSFSLGLLESWLKLCYKIYDQGHCLHKWKHKGQLISLWVLCTNPISSKRLSTSYQVLSMFNVLFQHIIKC